MNDMDYYQKMDACMEGKHGAIWSAFLAGDTTAPEFLAAIEEAGADVAETAFAKSVASLEGKFMRAAADLTVKGEAVKIRAYAPTARERAEELLGGSKFRPGLGENTLSIVITAAACMSLLAFAGLFQSLPATYAVIVCSAVCAGMALYKPEYSVRNARTS